MHVDCQEHFCVAVLFSTQFSMYLHCLCMSETRESSDNTLNVVNVTRVSGLCQWLVTLAKSLTYLCFIY